MEEVLEHINAQSDKCVQDCSILYLACHNPAFKEMNGAVSEYPGQMAIVLEGPDWFVRNKKHCWRRHHVIAAEQLSQVPVHFSQTMQLYCRQTRKWLGPEETARYLREHRKLQAPNESAM
ncbi:hypothetical protein DUZ99_15550 [Xylanibacillus composti]|nr:hypothetical protein [Xylanibacillus composti]